MSRNSRPQHDLDKDRAGMAGRVGNLARDNPVAAGGSVVMALTGCLIVANALGLQTGRHPAPLFMTRDWADVPQMNEPAGRLGAAAPQASALVLELQTALRRYGLYNGPLDGLNGPATAQAIRAYERSLGRIETGAPSEALLAVLTLQGAAPVIAPETATVPVPRPKPQPKPGFVIPGHEEAAPAEAVPPEPAADPLLAQIQQLLSDLGYGPLRADGLMGDNTATAIQRFELDRGLPITGRPSEAVISRLEMVSGRKIRR